MPYRLDYLSFTELTVSGKSDIMRFHPTAPAYRLSAHFVAVYVVALLAIGSIAFCQETALKQTADQPPNQTYQPVVNRDGRTAPQIQGVWQSRGYGYIAEVTDKDVRLYNETKSFLWQRKDVEAAELLFTVDASGTQARITNHPLIPPFVVDRIPAMPKDKKIPTQWTPTKLYGAFTETMNENYVFFEERVFDWQKRVEGLAPSIRDDMNDSELFDLLLRSLDGLDDAHVQLGATIDGEPRRAELGIPKTIQKGIEIFKNQTEFDAFEEFLNSRLERFEVGIAEKILGGKPNQSCDHLTWGTTGDNVGYLSIARMTDFSDTESLEAQLVELHAAMNEILSELSNTRAMIVDVSTNGGGMDLFSRAIASHFADTRRLAFSKGPRKAADIKHLIYVEPYSAADGGVTYSKPIFLVTDDITCSAAEIFVLCMKDLPHVTTVGKKTRGALSDVLSKTLPNGWAFGLSNEVYLDSQGVCYEATGIPPEVEMTVINPAEPDLGHAEAIAKIAAMAK